MTDGNHKITCFVTVPIAKGYNESKTNRGGKKTGKTGVTKIYCRSLESEKINCREFSITKNDRRQLLPFN